MIIKIYLFKQQPNNKITVCLSDITKIIIIITNPSLLGY